MLVRVDGYFQYMVLEFFMMLVIKNYLVVDCSVSGILMQIKFYMVFWLLRFCVELHVMCAFFLVLRNKLLINVNDGFVLLRADGYAKSS